MVLPPHTGDAELHWDYHTFCVRSAAGPCRGRPAEAPFRRKHTFGGFSQKIFSFSPSKFFSESSSMRAAQNWAQSYWARRGYPRTKKSEFGGPCRELSSSPEQRRSESISSAPPQSWSAPPFTWVFCMGSKLRGWTITWVFCMGHPLI